jgi:membrane protein
MRRGIEGNVPDVNIGRFVERPVAALDGYQRKRPWVSFPYAVIKKFSDDRASSLAALVAYYSFFGLFPLLLVFVTILGFVFRSNYSARETLVKSALNQFPVIGAQIGNNVRGLSGSTIALIIGIVGALWGGLGSIRSIETAMNQIWDVEGVDQPGFPSSLSRAFLMLLVIGGAIVLSSVLTGSVTGGLAVPTWLRLIALGGSLIVNLLAFALAFRILTVKDLTWRQVTPGAVVAAIGWVALQSLGGYYIGHEVASAGATYGAFALVIGLLSWLYLASQMLLISAEVNVVRVQRLWPRGMRPPLTEPDRRAFASYARAETRTPQQEVTVDYSDRGSTRAPGQPSSLGADRER